MQNEHNLPQVQLPKVKIYTGQNFRLNGALHNCTNHHTVPYLNVKWIIRNGFFPYGCWSKGRLSALFLWKSLEGSGEISIRLHLLGAYFLFLYNKHSALNAALLSKLLQYFSFCSENQRCCQINWELPPKKETVISFVFQFCSFAGFGQEGY